jgi:hypothetical protein
MFMSPVTRDNLPTAVDETLSECLVQLNNARDSSLMRDLTVARDALQLIKDELTGVRPQRPKGQRSAMFIRYALDENDQLAMDVKLKDIVVKIEDVYKRVWTLVRRSTTRRGGDRSADGAGRTATEWASGIGRQLLACHRRAHRYACRVVAGRLKFCWPAGIHPQAERNPHRHASGTDEAEWLR